MDRFERETANYQPSDRTRKRAKTGYNMFFSEYVRARVRQEGEMPLERGSTARVVGDAWKKMSVDEKEIYERQADEINEKDPVEAMDGFIRMPPPKPKQQPAPQQPVPPHPQFVNEEAPQMEPPPAPMQYEGPPMPDPNEMPPPPPPMPPPYGPPPQDYGMPGPPVSDISSACLHLVLITCHLMCTSNTGYSCSSSWRRIRILWSSSSWGTTTSSF